MILQMISQRKFRVQRFSDSICKASFPSFSEDFEDLQLQTSAPNRYFPLSGLKIDICLYLLQNWTFYLWMININTYVQLCMYIYLVVNIKTFSLFIFYHFPGIPRCQRQWQTGSVASIVASPATRSSPSVPGVTPSHTAAPSARKRTGPGTPITASPSWSMTFPARAVGWWPQRTSRWATSSLWTQLSLSWTVQRECWLHVLPSRSKSR